MSKNQIFTSPLGIGLGLGIGVALGTIVIGAIRSTILKYSKGESGDGEGIDEGSRSSSMFSLPEDSMYSRNSEGENNAPTKYTSAFNKEAPGYGHTKVRGGSKKRKRKGKGKNKFRTLKKV